MMDWANDSLQQVDKTRKDRSLQVIPGLDDETSLNLLNKFHPDYKGLERTVKVGPDSNSKKFPPELADLLESDSPLPEGYSPNVEIETDVLIIGGGGAGVSAALALSNSGLQVHLATKLRLGDSNTVMAEGGIQSAITAEDSSRRHFADSFVGGHGKNDPDLLRYLCEQGPASIGWLTEQGCLFDKNEDGTFRVRAGGGTSIPRVLACRDYTGLEIMRVLKDAVMTTGIHILEEHATVELLDDGEGQVTGAVLWQRNEKKLIAVSARAVILATGGSGQLRLQQYPTSNHIGATGDGLVLAYRQGCQLLHTESYQYHPSGASYPESLAGQLVTESIRSAGAQVVNAHGDRFISEMSYRDVLAAAIIREVEEGRGVETPNGRKGIWLDTPLVDMKLGQGTLRKQFPGLFHRFERYDIDPAKQPLLIYPTLHYQNGGIRIDIECRTDRKGLWAAGEVTGGLHGTNRLMGNSLLDIIVFGRRAARSVVEHLPERKPVTLLSLLKYREQLKSMGGTKGTSPQLFPKVSQMKFRLAEDSDAQENSVTAEPEAKGSFEPPDPFGGRFG
jgi:succinate dehydrogenase/fumarate reductase flavoprotein subunit